MQSVTEINNLARALGGVPELGCGPGSPSHKAGVRYGDILLSANGHRTLDLDAYMEARKVKRDAMSLVVFRDGREEVLELELKNYQASQTELETFFEENDSIVRVTVASSATGPGGDVI